MKVDKLAAWLTEVADIYIGLPGTLKVFDGLARQYADAADGDARARLLAESEAALAAIDSADTDQIGKATVYIKIMRKFEQTGASYVDDEVGRINKLTANPKLSETKKAEFAQKLNVLRSFKPAGKAGKGEL